MQRFIIKNSFLNNLRRRNKMIDTDVKNAMLEDTLRLVRVESITGDSTGIKKAQRLIEAIACNFDFKVEYKANNMIMEITPKGFAGIADLGVLLHVDTVPYTEKNWSADPLGEIKDDRIYGRGVIDDKGPIIQTLYAFHELGTKIRQSWKIIIGSFEEKEWIDLDKYFEEDPLCPNFMITVDGSGIQNGCRGFIDYHLKFSRMEKLNSSNSKFHLEKIFVPNATNNTVPGEAVAVINGEEIRAHGKAVHSSVPETGVNAIEVLYKMIINKYEINDYPYFFRFMRDMYQKNNASCLGFGYIESHTDGIHFDTKSSFAVTNCYIDSDDLLNVIVNVRLSPLVEDDEIEFVKENLRDDYCCSSVTENFTPGKWCNSNQPSFTNMLDSYEKVIGTRPNVSIAGAMTYCAAFDNCAISICVNISRINSFSLFPA